MKYKDLLDVVDSKKSCPVCNGIKEQSRRCDNCGQTGYKPIDLSGKWDNCSGFLVCGGPSINTLPYHKLGERGIVSLGINNVAAYVPVSAWCFSDPQEKFHHGLFLDPDIMTFAPIPKLRKKIRVKENGKFIQSRKRVRDCPNTYGFSRKTSFYPEQFLETTYAQWGHGGKQPSNEREFICLATMLLGIRLMCYLGCSEIYMLGVDFLRGTNEQYCFNQKASRDNGRYIRENTMLTRIKPTLEKNGINIFNCNPDSRCDAFPYVSFDDAYRKCKNSVPDEPFDLSGWYEKNK